MEAKTDMHAVELAKVNLNLVPVTKFLSLYEIGK